MLNVRLIPTLLLKDGRMVKSTKFSDYRDTGDPVKAAKVYNDQYVDELIFLNIGTSRDSFEKSLKILERVSEEIFMPLTFGGGIRNLDDIKLALKAGADKVSMSTLVGNEPEFIQKAAQIFGSQCLVVCLDYCLVDNRPILFLDSGKTNSGLNLFDFAVKVEKFGAGEILLQSIDKDGTRLGYDLNIIKKVSTNVSIPVIALGGASSLEDFHLALTNGGASAVSAASIFHFTDQSPIKARSYLKNKNHAVRAK